MRTNHLFFLPVLALLCVAGCPKDDTDTPDDTAEGDTDSDTDADTDTDTDADTDADADSDIAITSVGYSYDTGHWLYSLENDGAADIAGLTIIQEHGDRTIVENHRYRLTDESSGAWQVWGANLEIVELDYESSHTTTFEGTELSAGSLTWMASLNDGTGIADCVVWGAHPLLFEKSGCRGIVPN